MKKIKLMISFLLLSGAIINLTYSQTEWDTGGNYISGGEYLGADGNSLFPLELKTIPSLPINFYTTNTQRMTITSGGLVGIGTTNPIHKLDINDGNINLITSTRGYMISKQFVLWHNGNARNIYVGENAGNATATGSFNTFLGNKAGNLNTTGYQNTFTI